MEAAKFVDTKISKSIAELPSRWDQRTLVPWVADCAEHVLPYFEEKYPKDCRPRKAIEAGRACARGEIAMSEARTAAFSAHAAARDTNQAAARAAAPSDAGANTAKERNWQFQYLLDLGN
ncbi:hypothetical protein SAMN04487895_102283 [Paenibacillus sophorae]|uniref:Imm-5-like domain-containing protein n=1 Tax=Paenibacillus sophorae TaxID=1333845 RepID=A0A1H8IRP1_9BACL|nr:hypothetical protein [Paenibacillus sophorae]QWU16041.1 hypothetical protein KP014_01800 [Paenibacillus sophorae]SEN70656.1 hypothetical protein SAMN04487895_102283 [Paenibacillus sophorae]